MIEINCVSREIFTLAATQPLQRRPPAATSERHISNHHDKGKVDAIFHSMRDSGGYLCIFFFSKHNDRKVKDKCFRVQISRKIYSPSFVMYTSSEVIPSILVYLAGSILCRQLLELGEQKSYINNYHCVVSGAEKDYPKGK